MVGQHVWVVGLLDLKALESLLVGVAVLEVLYAFSLKFRVNFRPSFTQVAREEGQQLVYLNPGL